MPSRPGVDRGAEVALGFRVHSGWATLIAVGPSREPSVALRRRVELCEKTPRQPFHAAASLGLQEAEDLVERSRAEAVRLAGLALSAARRELERAGWSVTRGGMLTGGGRPLPPLEAVLASHPLIHTAEGELYRSALLAAAARAGVAIAALPERDLERRASQALARPPEELSAAVAAWGRALGPPWRREEKLASLAAWTALGGAGGASAQG